MLKIHINKALVAQSICALLVFCFPPKGALCADWIDNPLDAGAPKLPKDVIDLCLSRPDLTHSTCLAMQGWPSDKKPIAQPKCNPYACLTIPPTPQTKLEKYTETIGGVEMPIFYQNYFYLGVPTPGKTSDWKVTSNSYLYLINLQKNIDNMVRSALPSNSCEKETRIQSKSESVSGDTYTYAATIRTDVRSCKTVPCVPEVWKQCDWIDDIGHIDNVLYVRTRVFVENDKLKVDVNSEFVEGSVPPAIQALFKLEEFFNFATGNIFRSGNQKVYREAMARATQAAVESSGEKLNKRISVPGGAAFKFHVDSLLMEMTSQGVVLKVDMSGRVPESMICEVRDTLAELNNFNCVYSR